MAPNQYIEGTRLLNGDAIVTVAGKLLDPFPSQAVRNHSPTGFAWGYGGIRTRSARPGHPDGPGGAPRGSPNAFTSLQGGTASAGCPGKSSGFDCRRGQLDPGQCLPRQPLRHMLGDGKNHHKRPSGQAPEALHLVVFGRSGE